MNASLRMLRTCNFVLLGKIVNLLTQLSYLKERSYLTMQEIFNKVEQNQLQRTKNVETFLDATETLSISDFSRKHWQQS